MKKIIIVRLAFVFGIIVSLFCPLQATIEPPKLTIVIVVDQLAYHYIPKLQQYFKTGFKKLLDKGIVYTDAYLPHGMPGTGTGHPALETGQVAKYHGIISNKWFDIKGKSIRCDDDSAVNAAVFSTKGTYNYGKSPRNIMVSGISTQFKLAERPNTPHHIFSLSLKSRAAIGTANKSGIAIWFDKATGKFTSSKAYMNKLLPFVMNFNQATQLDKLKQINWNLVYKRNDPAYEFKRIESYDFASLPTSLIGKPIPIELSVNNKKPFELYVQTPHANQLVIGLAKECINTYVSKKKQDRMLLWINLSSLDKVGHTFGPESLEVIDMIYHLDNQLQYIIKYAQKKVGKNNVLFTLTADHGIDFIPEELKKMGLYHAQRIIISQLTTLLNEFIQKKYGVAHVVQNIKQPNVYLDKKNLEQLDKEKQQQIIRDLKTVLQKQPGIKTVWTYDELSKACFAQDQLENYFKMQLFPNRSGDLIIQTFPHVIITKHKTGAAHKTPNGNNIHIPLIIYHKKLKKNTITKKVSALQLANTLAKLLHTQKIPTSTFEILPGIIEKD